MEFEVALFNVVIVSIGFMLQLSAFTIFNVSKYILESIKYDYSDYNADGYVGGFITFLTMAFGNWLAPSLIGCMGPRATLFLGMLLGTAYIAQYLLYKDFLYYIGCILMGFGGSLIWTAQGHFMTLNSTAETVQRNSGIFWAIAQIGSLFGNLYILFAINANNISHRQRAHLFSVMTVISLVAALIMIIARKAVYEAEKLRPLETLIAAFKLFVTRDMLLLCVTFIYAGIEMAFYIGIYSNWVAFTAQLELKETTLIALSGLLIAIGEVFGGILFGILASKTTRWGHYPIVILGFIVHNIAFILIMLNIPHNAMNHSTYDYAVITPNTFVALLCSFLVGFGDSCYITQIYGTLGSVFAQQSAAAFAIFKFVHSIFSAVAFFYCRFGFNFHMICLIIGSILGTVCYCIVELKPTYIPPGTSGKGKASGEAAQN